MQNPVSVTTFVCSLLTDRTSLLPVNGVLLSSEHAQKQMNKNPSSDKRSAGYRQRKLSKKKCMETIIGLLEAAESANIPAEYVLFNSWFLSPKTIHTIKDLGYDVIVMAKKSPKLKFSYQGRSLSLKEIIRIYGKRWNIVVFYKVSKSYLRLAKKCRALSYDRMTAHVAFVFARYMMLSVENRESQNEQSLGRFFLLFE